MDTILSAQINTRGVVISGDEGTGKTSLSLELVEHSCFGRKYNAILSSKVPLQTENIGIASAIEDPTGQSMDPMKLLASNIVGYHFCQVRFKVFIRIVCGSYLIQQLKLLLYLCR